MSEIKEQQPVAAAPATEQPAAQPQPAAVPQQQEGFLAKHRVETGSQEWHDGFFDCFNNADNNLCLKGTFCPCFVYGRTQARLRDPTLQGYERINNDCLMFLGASYLCGLSFLFPFFKRGELRAKWDVRGNVLDDCLRSYFCMCCTLIQHEKEVIHRQATAKPEEGYQAVEGMSAQGVIAAPHQ